MERMFTVGSVESDHVSVTLLERAHLDGKGARDEGWIRSTIALRAGGFTAHVGTELRMDEIHRFADGLRSIDEALHGTAVLSSVEEVISLSVTCEPNGALAISGELIDAPESGNRLSFELRGFDQTHVPSWIAALDTVESSWRSGEP
jgi:hypothetical protein